MSLLNADEAPLLPPRPDGPEFLLAKPGALFTSPLAADPSMFFSDSVNGWLDLFIPLPANLAVTSWRSVFAEPQ